MLNFFDPNYARPEWEEREAERRVIEANELDELAEQGLRGVRCGHCREYHPDARGVAGCARRYWGARA